MEDLPLQSHPDFFYARPENLTRENTNPRYKFFRQNHFTAGDYEQFIQFWDALPGRRRKVPPLNPSVRVPLHLRWSKYKNPCVHDVFQTFLYISEKFKKGLFIKLFDRQMSVFLPFSKVNFTNEWHHKIQLDKRKFSSISQMMEFIAQQEDRPFVEGRVHKDVKSWYGNNGLVRLEFPISEGDSGCNMIKNMLDTLVCERNVPDCEFFVNKRDFPLLSTDGHEPYTSFFGQKVPLVSHHYDKYTSILGMTTTCAHADIPIPTWEDWCRVSYWHDQRLFAKEFRAYPTPEEFDAISWETKTPVLVFRGASTGLGTRLDNNPRLFFSALSAKKELDVDGFPFFDVGITRWNLRPRKHPDSPFLETIHVKEMPFDLVPSMDPLEQARFKYILHLPGHSCAYRLSLELFSGSVVFLYPCTYKLWFSDWLQPWVHYIPIDPALPNDVYEKIRWCKENDDKAQLIAKRAREFAHTFLTRDYILDYLQAVLWQMAEKQGIVQHAPKSLEYLFRERVNHEVQSMEKKMDTIISLPVIQHIFRQYRGQETLSKSYLLYFIRHLLHSDPTILEKMCTEMIFETPKTKVQRVVWKGFPDLVLKETKYNWHQNFQHVWHLALSGLNQIADQVPNFIHTYWSKEEATHWSTIMDYCQGTTLEKFIKQPNTSLNDLVDIWLQLCLALHVAQQRIGFLHMDLYPWNIIISESDEPVEITYPISLRKSIRISTNRVGVIIDYEKSHYVKDGVHFYNTTPFRFCRIQDIISIVFSCLHLYLECKPIAERDVSRLFYIMNYFVSPYTGNSRFRSISHIRMFLKKHKKFSKMMMEPKSGLEDRTPMDFYYHILHPQFHQEEISIPKQDPFVFFGPLYELENVRAELDILSTLFLSDKSILLEEKKTTLRRYWMNWEKSWNAKDNGSDHVYENFVKTHALSYLKDRFQGFERFLGCKIWERLSWEEIVGTPLPVPKEFIWTSYQNKIKELSFRNFSSPRIMPLLSTHVCPKCIKRTIVPPKSYSMDEFQKILIMAVYYFPEKVRDMDFFRIWTLEFNDQFKDFLHLGL